MISSVIRKAFGKRIRQLRRIRSWSQEELAARAGISQKSLSAIERGDRNITFNGILKIAEGLKVEMCQLFFFQYPGLKPKSEIASEEIFKFMNTASAQKKELVYSIIQTIFNFQDEQK